MHRNAHTSIHIYKYTDIFNSNTQTTIEEVEEELIYPNSKQQSFLSWICC